MKGNRITLEDSGAAGPDFAKFKDSEPGPVEPDPDDMLREKEKERARRRRAKVKAERDEKALEFDVDTCTMLNDWILGLAGAITKREIQISEAQHSTLDKCLVKIGNKYGSWIAGYMSELMYGLTLFIVVKQSPTMPSAAPIEAVNGAQGAEQNSVDSGPQGLR